MYQVILEYNPQGDYYVNNTPFSVKIDSKNGTRLRLEYHKEMLKKTEEGIRKQMKEYPNNPQKWVVGLVYYRENVCSEDNSKVMLTH